MAELAEAASPPTTPSEESTNVTTRRYAYTIGPSSKPDGTLCLVVHKFDMDDYNVVEFVKELKGGVDSVHNFERLKLAIVDLKLNHFKG